MQSSHCANSLVHILCATVWTWIVASLVPRSFINNVSPTNGLGTRLGLWHALYLRSPAPEQGYLYCATTNSDIMQCTRQVHMVATAHEALQIVHTLVQSIAISSYAFKCYFK